jgi:hypothetical protein
VATNANVALGITATNATNGAFRAARANVVSMRTGLNGMAGSVQKNRRLVQQFGMQLSDFSVQIAGGQSAILALTQQVPQFVQGFGAMGGVLAALITVFGTVALIMTKTGASLDALTPIAGVLTDEVRWLAEAFEWVKWVVIEAANLIVNNLDRIAIATALLVGWWTGGLIVAAVAATGVIGTLTAAFWLLVAAMRAVVFIAILTLITEAIYRFMELANAVGGAANAFWLIWAVVQEAFDRVVAYASYLWTRIKAYFVAGVAAVAGVLGTIVGYAIDVWERVVNSGSSMVSALGAIFSTIEAGWRTMVANMGNAWGTFLSAIGAGMQNIPGMEDAGWDLQRTGMIAISESRMAMGAANDAAKAGATLSTHLNAIRSELSKPMVSKDNWLSQQSVILKVASAGYTALADAMQRLQGGDWKSISAIQDALAGLPEETQIDVRDWFQSVEEGSKGAGDASKKAAKDVETFGDAVAGVITSGFDRLFDSIFEGGKKAIDVLRDMGKELLKMVAKQQFFGFLAKLMPNTFGAGGFVDLTKGMKPFAKGGVVNSATSFPMRGGKTGLTGEAGPEAILPLTRGSNGALGVQSAGGGGSNVQVNIMTPPGTRAETSQRSGPGGMTIQDIVIKEVTKATAEGRFDRINRQRYGNEPVPAKR